jgi:hypothetical protein
VSCQQPATQRVPDAPRADRWITLQQNVARLSDEAAKWIADVLGIVDKEREYRAIEHGCLDEAAKKGYITQ